MSFTNWQALSSLKNGFCSDLGFDSMSVIMSVIVLGSSVTCKKAVLPVFVWSSCLQHQSRRLSQEGEQYVRKG